MKETSKKEVHTTARLYNCEATPGITRHIDRADSLNYFEQKRLSELRTT